MEKLYSVADIMQRYGKSRATAIRYMKQMKHQERPYMVTESALRAWDESRTVNPPELIRAEMRRRKMMRRLSAG